LGCHQGVQVLQIVNLFLYLQLSREIGDKVDTKHLAICRCHHPLKYSFQVVPSAIIRRQTLDMNSPEFQPLMILVLRHAALVELVGVAGFFAYFLDLFDGQIGK
jgi:hypothetical protein